MTYIAVDPHDPLIARDGRPFGLGANNRMRCADWLYPSVLAGSVRTVLGKATARDGEAFSKENVTLLKEVAIAGPLPFVNRTIYLPAPADCVWFKEEGMLAGYRSGLLMRGGGGGETEPGFEPGEGCDIPHQGLVPVVAPQREDAERSKPASVAPRYWSVDRMAAWLAEDGAAKTPLKISAQPAKWEGYLQDFEREQRTHVRIDPATGRAQDGDLYSTCALVLRQRNSMEEIGLAARVEAPMGSPYFDVGKNIRGWHSVGGERRLAWFDVDESLHDAWMLSREKSDELSKAVASARGLRMVMATHAIFRRGWLPGWLNPENLTGEPPFGHGLVLRLRAAAVGRWIPISGWNLERGQTGPKPVRRMVPAGSVYYFEVEKGDAAAFLSDLWLQSVCDHEQDRRDGFGLAVWGAWQ